MEKLQTENAGLKEEIAARDVEIAELKGDALYGKIMVYSNVILYAVLRKRSLSRKKLTRSCSTAAIVY